jgi:murein DD-endopeptidase MepM/ murein hydrolase activator NlpD
MRLARPRTSAARAAGATIAVALTMVGLAPAGGAAAAGLPASSAVSAALTTVSVVTQPTLTYGSHGTAVVRLQKLLGVHPDGQFGPVTLAAVRAFQKRSRLRVTGVVDNATWNALIAASRASRDGRRDASLFACPVDGPVHFTDTFGIPGRPSTGTDMLAARGTPVVAIEAGTVVKLYADATHGLAVVLRGTSGDEWLYSHNDRNLVRAGERVAKGQRLGLVGSTGSAGTVNELHFEWWPNAGAARDPYPIVKAACG